MTERNELSGSLSEFFDLEDTNTQDANSSKKPDSGWTSITRIRTARTTTVPPDIFDLLGKISKSARDLFIEIKLQMDYKTHLALLPHQDLTRSQKNKRSQAIIELENTGKGLARRVPRSGILNREGETMRHKPSTFILTPEYIFPCKYFVDDIRFIWEQCAR